MYRKDAETRREKEGNGKEDRYESREMTLRWSTKALNKASKTFTRSLRLRASTVKEISRSPVG